MGIGDSEIGEPGTGESGAPLLLDIGSVSGGRKL